MYASGRVTDLSYIIAFIEYTDICKQSMFYAICIWKSYLYMIDTRSFHGCIISIQFNLLWAFENSLMLSPNFSKITLKNQFPRFMAVLLWSHYDMAKSIMVYTMIPNIFKAHLLADEVKGNILQFKMLGRWSSFDSSQCNQCTSQHQIWIMFWYDFWLGSWLLFCGQLSSRTKFP